MIAPVIKWSGSKRSQAGKIVSFFPDSDSYSRYFEPFIGGGSILRALSPKRAIVGDICKPLICLWEAIKDKPYIIMKKYRESWEKFQEKDSYYYEVRDRFNKSLQYFQDADPSDFLFLTRTCINGLIRFNRNGEFNSPCHIGRPGIHPDKMDSIISDWSVHIKNVSFQCSDFVKLLEEATYKDIAYLDPPYYNTKGMYGGSFCYKRLLDCLESMNSRNVKWILSYDGKSGDSDHTVDLPKELYKRHEYIDSGVSSFKRIIKQEKVFVKESLYLNF